MYKLYIKQYKVFSSKVEFNVNFTPVEIYLYNKYCYPNETTQGYNYTYVYTWITEDIIMLDQHIS